MTRVSKQDGGNKLTITCRKRRRKEGWNKLCNLKISWMDTSWQVNRNSGRDQRENLFLDGQDDEWLQCPVHGQQHMDTESWRDREREEEEGREEREWGVCVYLLPGKVSSGRVRVSEWEWKRVEGKLRAGRHTFPIRFSPHHYLDNAPHGSTNENLLFLYHSLKHDSLLLDQFSVHLAFLWRQPEALPVIKRPVSSAAQSRYQHDQNVINKTKVSTQPRYQHNRSINTTETNPSRCSSAIREKKMKCLIQVSFLLTIIPMSEWNY